MIDVLAGVRVIVFTSGVAIVIATLLSAVKTVVVPRAVVTRIGRLWFLAVRRVLETVAHERRTFEERDRVMAFYAPIALVMLPGIWVAFVIVGFAMIQWSILLDGFGEALVLSGSAVSTLGFSRDGHLASDVAAIIEATLGLGIVALLISYLPSIYGSFSRREALVAMLEVRAGIPPSPAELLTRYQRIGFLGSLDEELFPAWEQWFVEIEESHTSIPALAFFRSPQPERSWVTAAGCVLDTAALYHSSVDTGRVRSPRAALTLRTGFFALRRIAAYFSIEFPHAPNPDDPISITRREFDLVMVELQAVGVPLRADLDQAWRDYAGWRVNYDQALIALARLTMAPPGRWSSDRDVPRPKVRLRTKRRR